MSDILNQRRERLAKLIETTGETVQLLNFNNSTDQRSYSEDNEYRIFSLSSRGDNPNAIIKITLGFKGGNSVEQQIFAGDAYNLEINNKSNQINDVTITELTSNDVHIVYNLVSKRI